MMERWTFWGRRPPQSWWPKRKKDYHCYRNLSYKQPVTHSKRCATVDDLLSGLVSSELGNKHCLDLYLPAPSTGSARPPLVVFVHGGGWRRGDRQGWRHYVSDCDTNTLVALLFWAFGLYGSVGETLAGGGVACAVVSYPLSRLPFPRCLVEHFLSFSMSLVPTWLLLLLCTVCADFSGKVAELSTALEDGRLLYLGAVTFLLAITIRWLIVLRQILAQISAPVKGRAWLATLGGSLGFAWLCTLCLQGGGPGMLTYARVALIAACLLVEAVFVLLYLHAAPIQHPDHVRAIATCVAWLLEVGRTAAGVGGASMGVDQAAAGVDQAAAGVDRTVVSWEPGGVYLMGHSAGGHLVALLALDHTFLWEVGLRETVVKGVLTISGVYDLSWMSSPPLSQYYLRPAFGSCRATWCQASPLQLLRTSTATPEADRDAPHFPLPPFLICCAATELPGLTAQAQDFCRELKARGACATYHVIANTNHFFIVPALKPRSQLERLCLEFVNGVNSNAVNRPPCIECYCY